jgi:hypothetical protein
MTNKQNDEYACEDIAGERLPTCCDARDRKPLDSRFFPMPVMSSCDAENVKRMSRQRGPRLSGRGLFVESKRRHFMKKVPQWWSSTSDGGGWAFQLQSSNLADCVLFKSWKRLHD